MAKRVTIAATVCSAALVAATFTGAVAVDLHEKKPTRTASDSLAQKSVKIPSDSEVAAAKVDPKTKSALLSNIKSELDKTSGNYDKIAEQAQQAWDALSEAQQVAVKRQEQASEAARQAKAADAKLTSSRSKVGQIASEIYKNGGDDQAKTLLSKNPQANLDRTETTSKLAESRSRDLKSSQRDANLAGQWQKYHDATKKQADDAVEQENRAQKTAREQATAYRVALQRNDADRETLLKKLADLNGTTVEQERAKQEKREDAVREAKLKKAKEAAAAKEAQRKLAAQKAAYERQQREQQERAAVAKPANVVSPKNQSDGAQEEGASSDAEAKAEQEKQAAAKAKKQQEEREAAQKREKEAEQAQAAAQKKKADAAAKKKADQEAEKAAEAKKKAEEKQEKAQRQAQDDASESSSSQKSAAEKAKAKKEAEQAAAKQKQEQERAAADRAAQQRRQAAADKKAQERKQANERAAAKRAAAQRAAEQRAAAKRAAEQRAAAKAAAEKKKREEAAQNSGSGSSTGSSSKEAAISWALGIAGNDYYGYVYGGNGPRFFDCSSFVLNAFQKSGVSTTRTANSQYFNAPTHIPLSQLKRGDLVFSSSNGGSSFYHVAIYLGNGQVVQARNPSAGISTTPLSWVNNLYAMGARY